MKYNAKATLGGGVSVSTILALASGGIKSAVAAGRYALEHEIVLLHVDYGQASAGIERRHLGAMAEAFPSGQVVGIELPHVRALDRRTRVAADASPTDADTLSPLAMRGLMPLLVATGLQCAVRTGASALVVGLTEVSAEVSSLLASADGQPGRAHEFVQTADMMFEAALPEKHRINLEAPLIDVTYGEAIKLAVRFHVPLENTWSCAGPGPRPCTKCSACRARQEAFSEARLLDPTMTIVGARETAPT
jgi:7-cyano-7-deazaguanine synthase